MTRSRALFAALVTTAALAGAAPTGAAAAVQRYASPTGFGTACTAVAPCSYVTAINSIAPGGAEVIVAPGDYGSATDPITGDVYTLEPADVHGVAGQPRPRIFSSASKALGLLDAASTARHLELTSVAGSEESVTFDFPGLLAEDVIAHSASTDSASAACRLTKAAVVRNSVCWSEETGVNAIHVAADGPDNVTLRNVTAVSLGPGAAGLYASSETGGNTTVTVVNSVIEGIVGVATNEAGSGITTVTPTYSNLVGDIQTVNGGTVTPSDTNIPGNALFIDLSGDYHQTPMSPTINKGSGSAANGTNDFDGQARTAGGTTDIGADEFLAPVATTGAASKRTRASARIAGTLNSRNVSGLKAHFEYGPTTAYGLKTADQSLGASNANQTRTAQIGGLTRNKTYHYRVVLQGPAGDATGADQAFRTLPKFSGLEIPKQSVTVKQGVAKVKVKCASAVGSCHGPLKLSRKNAKGKKPSRIQLGKANFDVAPGQATKVPVSLDDAALEKLSADGTIKARAKSEATDDAGATRPRTRKLTLKKPKPTSASKPGKVALAR